MIFGLQIRSVEEVLQFIAKMKHKSIQILIILVPSLPFPPFLLSSLHSLTLLAGWIQGQTGVKVPLRSVGSQNG